MAKKFKKVSKSELRKRIDNISSGGRTNFLTDVLDIYKMKDGDNFIRILPPVGKSDDFGVTVSVHNWVGPNRDSVICPEKMHKKSCPVCKVHRLAQKKGLEELAKETRPTQRTIFIVLDTHTKNRQSEDPLVMDAPQSLADDILRACVKKKTGEVIDISHPTKGREIYFDRTKVKGKKYPEYRGATLEGKYPIDDDLAELVPTFSEVIKEADEEILEDIAEFYEEPIVSERGGKKKKKKKKSSEETKKKKKKKI